MLLYLYLVILWVSIVKIGKKKRGYRQDSHCRIKCLNPGEQFWQPPLQYELAPEALKINQRFHFFLLVPQLPKPKFTRNIMGWTANAWFLPAFSCQFRDVQSETQTPPQSLEVRNPLRGSNNSHHPPAAAAWSLAAVCPFAEKHRGMEWKGCCCLLSFAYFPHGKSIQVVADGVSVITLPGFKLVVSTC